MPQRQIPKSFCHELKRLETMNVLDISPRHCVLKEQFIIGSVDIARSGAVFLCNLNGNFGDFKLEGGRYAKFKQGDIVLAKVLYKRKHPPKRIAKNNENNKKKSVGGRAKFLEILFSPRRHIIAMLQVKKGSIKAIELGAGHGKYGGKDRYFDLKASQKSLRELPQNCIIKLEYSSGQITEVLGVLDDPCMDEKIVLERYGRSGAFSADSEKFAQAFGESVDAQMYPQREDLQHLPFCVIDPSDARDHDDAIYFEKKTHTLYVAIADVSEYVSANSVLDSEAMERGFSVYLPHKVVPMLPFALSAGICSLSEGVTRLAMVWKIHLSPKAQVIESSLVEGIIKVHSSVSYECVQEFLDTGVGLPRAVGSWLKAFIPYVKKLRALRLINGYEFESEEVKLILDSQNRLVDLNLLRTSFAHHVIEESMLLANVQSAKMLQDNTFKGLFRIHPPPHEDKIAELAFEFKNMGFEVEKARNIHDLITSIQAQAKKKMMCQMSEESDGICKSEMMGEMASVLDGIIIRSFAKARYDEENRGHFGLGFDCYTHFTSPIRRYADLLVHRILKAILKQDKSLGFLLESLSARAYELNIKEKEVGNIELEFANRTLARYAKEYIRDQRLILQALVLDEFSHCMALEALPSARIILPYSLDRLSIVKVEIVGVDLVQNLIFGEVLS